VVSRNYAHFEKRLESADLAGVGHLLPPSLWDLFYLDHALWADDEVIGATIAILEVLHPGIELVGPEDGEKNGVWRNGLRDAMVAWSHAFHKRDYLVTGNGNFLHHAARLKPLGVAEILSPDAAARLCVGQAGHTLDMGWRAMD